MKQIKFRLISIPTKIHTPKKNKFLLIYNYKKKFKYYKNYLKI